MIVRSPRFKRYFIESPPVSQKKKDGIIALQDVTGPISLNYAEISNAFQELRSYFYQDYVEWSSVNKSLDCFVAFIVLSKRLELKHLVKLTVEAVEEYLSSINVVRFLNKIIEIIAKEPPLHDKADPVFSNFFIEVAFKCLLFLYKEDALAEDKFQNFSMGDLSLPSLNFVLQAIYGNEENMTHKDEPKVSQMTDDPTIEEITTDQTPSKNEREMKKFMLIVNWMQSNRDTNGIGKEDLIQYVDLNQLNPEIISSKITVIKKLSPERYSSALEAIISTLLGKYNKLEEEVQDLRRLGEEFKTQMTKGRNGFVF